MNISRFQANVSFLFSLQISENLWLSDDFTGYKIEKLAGNVASH